jgi:endonuclease YncB( thermonuclease family)
MTSPHRLCLMALLTLLIGGWVTGIDAHRSGCHRWHSCPADHGTYTCGDLGSCAQCPDNQFCQSGQPRASAKPPTASQPPSPSPNPTPAPAVKVTRVIDGDTLQLSTGEKVRLIGVGTPETKDPRKPVQYFGKEATAFTKHLVEGKPVRLAYDQPHHDKYGRTLASVYLEHDTFVNAEIIR